MLICLAAKCTATYSLSKYEDHQDNIERFSQFRAQVHNNDIIAAEVLTIVFCVFVATLFGADFFFLVFWPRRVYPRWYDKTKRVLAVGITMGVAAAALMSTIVIAKHSERITGVPEDTARQYAEFFFRPPLRYRSWAVNIPYVVLLWLGLLATIAITVVMFMASAHDSQYGAEPSEPVGGINNHHNGNLPEQEKPIRRSFA